MNPGAPPPSIRPVPILAFHKVDDRFEWGVTRIGRSRFCRVVSELRDWGYASVSLTDCADPGRLPEKPVVLTFDDSYESVLRNALPVLASAGFKATLFVITDYIGRENAWDVNLGWIRFTHLDWPGLRELRDAGWEIGSHTARHPDLTRISASRVESELRDSRRILEDGLNRPVRFLSFPFGRYNDTVLDAMRLAGYEKAVGFRLRKPEDKTLVFERKAYYLFDGRLSLRSKLTGSPLGFLENIKLRVINFFSHGTALVKPSSD
ncbi:MAG: polysaccharide deacetylase family protein [bacterium]|nr:polysaccharide deacetylase family protein [bacterium]